MEPNPPADPLFKIIEDLFSNTQERDSEGFIPHFEDIEFQYIELCFHAHPIGFKTKLVDMAMKFNLLPRAARKLLEARFSPFWNVLDFPKTLNLS